jgi:hypothetical protein
MQNGHDKKVQSKRRTRPPRYRYGVRTDSGPIALQAFWSMHVEAMNWSGMGYAEYAAALNRLFVVSMSLFRAVMIHNAPRLTH